jgi:hypothetical protein
MGRARCAHLGSRMAVERHGIYELCCDDPSRQARSGHALGDDLRRHGGDARQRYAVLAITGRI